MGQKEHIQLCQEVAKIVKLIDFQLHLIKTSNISKSL
jgi:hypothetical protein